MIRDRSSIDWEMLSGSLGLQDKRAALFSDRLDQRGNRITVNAGMSPDSVIGEGFAIARVE